MVFDPSQRQCMQACKVSPWWFLLASWGWGHLLHSKQVNSMNLRHRGGGVQIYWRHWNRCLHSFMTWLTRQLLGKFPKHWSNSNVGKSKFSASPESRSKIQVFVCFHLLSGDVEHLLVTYFWATLMFRGLHTSCLVSHVISVFSIFQGFATRISEQFKQSLPFVQIWRAANGALRSVRPPFPPNSPFSGLFRPFPEGPTSSWEILKTEEKGLISSNFLRFA